MKAMVPGASYVVESSLCRFFTSVAVKSKLAQFHAVPSVMVPLEVPVVAA